MSIEVKLIEGSQEDLTFLNPIDTWGTEYGTVYQMFSHGEAEDAYMVATGFFGDMIYVWYNEEEKRHELATQTKAELKEYSSHVKFVKIDGAIIFSLDFT